MTVEPHVDHYAYFPTSPMRKERSAVVKRSLKSKASKVSQAKADKTRKCESPTNSKKKTVVKTVGIGNRKSIIDAEPTSSSKRTLPGILKLDSLNLSKHPKKKHSEDDTKTRAKTSNNDWEVVKKNDDGKSNVTFSEDDQQVKQEPPRKMNVLEIAADAADKSLTFIGENVHKVVLSTLAVLNKD